MFSIQFAKAYFITMRPYLLFVSGITGLVGMAFHPAASFVKSAMLFAACFLSYGFGQALTDCFQIDTDSLSSPYRPLTQGRISRRDVLVTSAAGLSLCIAVFAICNPLNLLLGCVCGAGLLTYTYFKRRWWGGPFYNAWIVVVLCVMAYLAGPVNVTDLARSPFPWALLTVFAGYANFVLVGYFKDIRADRATGYHTLPVVAGITTAAWISDGFALVTIAGGVITFSQLQSSPANLVLAWIPLLFFGGGVFSIITAQVRLHRVRSDEEAHAAVAPTVHGYILLLSGIIGRINGAWLPLLALQYAAFSLTMRFRPAKHQI